MGSTPGTRAATPGRAGLETVDAVTEDTKRLVFDDAGRISVGGMGTKLEAAQKAAASGIPMVIASGRESGTLARVLRGAAGGHVLPAARRPPRVAQAMDRLRGAPPGPPGG